MLNNRRWLSAALAAVLVLAGLVAMPFSHPQPVQAAAASGHGQHAGSIFWLDWSSATRTAGSGTNNGRPFHRVQNGTRLVATPAQGVTVTAEFSQVLATQRGGTAAREVHVTQQDPNYSELKLNGYDTGQQYSVITPNTNQSNVNFRLTFTATLADGSTIPLNVIAADGESAGPPQNESIAFTTNGEPWRNIDNTTRAGANIWWSNKTQPGQYGGFNTTTMGPWVTERSTGQGMAPIGVSRGASTVDVAISATGMQNVMVGFMLATDFGDAPASYGQASHFIDWTAKNVDPRGLPGTTDAPGITYDWSSNPYLGTVPADPDSGQLGGWTGDDTTGTADEGWKQLTGQDDPPVMYPGERRDYSVTVAVGNGNNRTVAGWIDWNNDGVFQAGERATAVATEGSAILTWADVQVPSDARALGSRFRVASDAQQIQNPTGPAPNGEVEDHLLSVTQPALASVVKSSNPDRGTDVRPGQKVDYTLTFSGSPDAPTDVRHTDHLAVVLDDADLDSDSIKTTGGLTATFDQPQQTLAVSGRLLAGAEPATVTYSVTVKDFAATTDQLLRNVVVPSGTVPPETCASAATNCTEHPVVDYSPNLVLGKASDPVSGSTVAPGDPITYTVTTTNQAGAGADAASVGPAAGVVLTDDLTDVLDDASFIPGSARLEISGGPEPITAPVADPVEGLLTTEPFDLPANGTAALTYRVTVHDDAWSATIGNVVSGAWDDPGTPEPSDPIDCASCSTEHGTDAKVLIEKIGESSDGWVRMDGSDWSVRHDDGGAPGEVLEDPLVDPVAGTGGGTTDGLFTLEGISAGTYWLTETRAPEGFSLLAEPVQFTVDADGAVTLGSGEGDGVVTSADEDADGIHTVTVRDVPALRLPETGGTGSAGYLAVGAGLLALGAALALQWRRREPAVSQAR
ncbi:CshA/CshB family fibrillar adhesin-related protein [Citricoccus alkalitolerans]|uniref:CshA/CshB family fibrillar adhesin-related protein n=1 Tax=Citricoccus alkalitolerans TaxID=246603 RepID=A0ABV8XUF1_9MICC